MKKIIALLCTMGMVAMGLSEYHAQDARFGLKGGVTYYKGTVDANLGFFSLELESDSRIGFSGGLFMEYPLSDLISIQPEILFIQKNQKESEDFFELNGFNDFNDFDDFDDEPLVETTLSYIDVPVLLKVNIPLEGDVQPFITVGPYVGYLLDAKDNLNGTDEFDDFDDIGSIKDLVKDFNYGLIIGGGVNFGNLFLELRYDMGLANIFDEDELMNGDLNDFDDDFDLFGDMDISARISGLSFSIGIRF